MPKLKIVDGVEIELTAEEEIARDAEIAEFKKEQEEYLKIKYKDDRLKEYPSLQECIHAILDNDLEALQELRKAVKLKYPKPSK